MKRLTTKEDRLRLFRKMDAVNLQGVWTNFPQQVAASTGRGQYAAGLLEQLARQRAEQMRLRKLPRKVRRLLIDEVIARIQRDDADDLVTVLAI